MTAATFRSIPCASLALLSVALLSLACEHKPTQPRTTTRTVTAILSDSLGSSFGSATLYWSRTASDGSITALVGLTDGSGANRQDLEAGAWTVTTHVPGRVAGASFAVAGSERASSDSEVVRLTLHTPSTATGVALLAGRTDHRDIQIASAFLWLAGTDSTGTWSYSQLAPGRWTLEFDAFGYRTVTTDVTVPAPGSTVRVDTLRLVPGP